MNRTYSLKKGYEIEQLIKSKMSVGNKYYAIYYGITGQEKPKIAFSITKRIKTAVQRNYEKRVLKEIFRKNLAELKNLKMLVVAKKTVQDLTFKEKETQIMYLVKKITRSRNEKTK